MVDLPLKSHPLFHHWDDYRKLLDALSPVELAQRRDAAIARFVESGVPTRKDEEFRYLPLHALSDVKFAFPMLANVERRQIKDLVLDGIDAIQIVFVNGFYAPELAIEDDLPDGVVIDSLDEVGDYEGLGATATLDGKLGSSNDERFVDLNTAFFSTGALIRVPRGISVARPIHVRFISSNDKPTAAFPRVLIHVEDGSSAKLIESYSTIGKPGFTCAVSEVRVGHGANLEHVRVQDESLDVVHVGTVAVHQEAESVYSSCNVQFGGSVGRVDLNVWLNGERTETWLNGVYIGRADQTLDNHTRIDHAKPNCNSFEVYKGVLADQSTGVFNGKIFVYEDAQKTDAKQTNQAILLSPTATIDTKPQLEIFADDVKCTHGATVGRLRDDAMFYLRARGIPKAEAEAMLVYAFAAEVIEKIGIEDVRTRLEEMIFRKLGD